MLKIVRIAAVLIALQSPAWAQTRTLTVAGYAGSLETTLRAEVIPAFEKRHGAKVDYLPGNSTETLARLQSGAKTIDVAIADDWAIAQGIQSGLCGRIDGLPVDDLYAAARFTDDKAVALGLAATGLVYNTRFFEEKGWKPPVSWNDLRDPKYRKLLVMPPIASSYGLEALVMLARANGGGESNIDPGFKALKDQIGPNVLAYEAATSRITELFNAGQARIVVWSSGRAHYFANAGDPIGFVYPREGAPVSTAAACPAARAGTNALASEFVKALLQPGLQLLYYRDYGYAPVRKSVAVPAARAALAPVGDRAASLVTLDWDTINAHRDEWTRRWIREIGP